MAKGRSSYGIGYDDGDNLQEVDVDRNELWQSKHGFPFYFCAASRCMLRASNFSVAERSKPLQACRMSMKRPAGISIEKWTAMADTNHRSNRTINQYHLDNREFAVKMLEWTRLDFLTEMFKAYSTTQICSSCDFCVHSFKG